MHTIRFFARSTSMYALALSLLMAPASTGCAAMLSVGNPSAAVKVAEGAGMNVVVRRAEAAVQTATEVDRLLIVTPVGGKAKWPEKILITPAQAEKILLAASKTGVYEQQPADIMPVEVWARLLPGLEAKEGDHASLLSRIHPDLAKSYAEIIEKHEAHAALREQATRAEQDLDEREDQLDEAAKAEAKRKLDSLDSQADAAEEAFQQAKSAFVDQARALAVKTEPAVRDETGPVLVRLREAVSDADVANGAAMVRYPLAVTSLVGDAQKQAAIFLADVIEEKAGARPRLDGVSPTVTLDGLTPQIGINGLTSQHLGKLNAGEVTAETVKRTGEWISKAGSLMVWAPSTSAALSYQGDVLDAILEGYEEAGWTRAAELEIESRESAQE